MERAGGVHERSGASTDREEAGSGVSDAGFRHEALLYEGADQFVATVGAFVAEGVTANEGVLVAVSAPKQELLRQALGSDARRALFAQIETLGRNPGCLIAAWLRFIEEQ